MTDLQSTVQRIVSELEGRRNGKGWMVRCPAHADRNPSLSVDIGAEGRPLVKCFAGCSQDRVIGALRDLGLWPRSEGHAPSVNRPITALKAPRLGDTGPNIGLPPADARPPVLGEASTLWCYRNSEGHPLFHVARIDSMQGKRFQPYSWDRKTGGWVNQAWPAPRPLYGLDHLAKSPEAEVLIVEGEKSADAARAMMGNRFVVVTWPNGAQAVRSADWRPLHGKRILIWPDADEPGLKAAREIVEILRPHCPEIRLIRIDLKNPDAFTRNVGFDAADAKKLEWGYDDFLFWSTPKIETAWKSIQFDSVADSIDRANSSRAAGVEGICPTGIRFLDLATGGGIGKDDVMLLAGPTGAGKTEAALAIASHNATIGKRAYYFALEAAEYEITNRLLYREIANLYFESKVFRKEMLGKRLNYVDFLRGKYGTAIQDLENQAAQRIREKYKKLHIFYRTREFGLEQLAQQVEGIKEKADLIALDHIHYVDLNNSESENRAMSDLIKGIKDLAQLCRKPFLVVAHIRKRDTRTKPLLPDLEDVHGSSNLGKIASLAVTLAPCFEESQKPGQFFTYMRVVKNRYGQERTRYAAVCTFDASQNRYEQEFRPGRLIKDGAEFEPLSENEIPEWMKTQC